MKHTMTPMLLFRLIAKKKQHSDPRETFNRKNVNICVKSSSLKHRQRASITQLKAHKDTSKTANIIVPKRFRRSITACKVHKCKLKYCKPL